MGFLFTPKNKGKTIIIFDIGSGSVAGAIVKIMDKEEDKNPEILLSHRIEIPHRDLFNFNILSNDMLKTLNRVAISLVNSNLANSISEIHCVLASPWYLSEARTIKISKEDSFVFTQKMADDLITNEVSLMKGDYESKYGRVDDISELIENHITSVSLDGISTFSPVGKKCKNVEMDLILSLSPQGFLDEIKEKILSTFHEGHISFSSFMTDFYLSMREEHNLESYFLVDIAGEVTDVAIVIDGVIKSSFSFPIGKKQIFRDICTTFDSELRDAKELFSLFNSNHLSMRLKQKLLKALDATESHWLKNFNELSATALINTTLPQTIFLTADDDVINWFKHIIKKDSYNSIVSINDPSFFGYHKDGNRDIFLAIEAIAKSKKINK